MQHFDTFNKNIIVLSAIFDFMPQKKCSTLTNWHTSDLDWAHVSCQKTTKTFYMSKNKVVYIRPCSAAVWHCYFRSHF